MAKDINSKNAAAAMGLLGPSAKNAQPGKKMGGNKPTNQLKGSPDSKSVLAPDKLLTEDGLLKNETEGLSPEELAKNQTEKDAELAKTSAERPEHKSVRAPKKENEPTSSVQEQYYQAAVQQLDETRAEARSAEKEQSFSDKGVSSETVKETSSDTRAEASPLSTSAMGEERTNVEQLSPKEALAEPALMGLASEQSAAVMLEAGLVNTSTAPEESKDKFLNGDVVPNAGALIDSTIGAIKEDSLVQASSIAINPESDFLRAEPTVSQTAEESKAISAVDSFNSFDRIVQSEVVLRELETQTQEPLIAKDAENAALASTEIKERTELGESLQTRPGSIEESPGVGAIASKTEEPPNAATTVAADVRLTNVETVAEGASTISKLASDGEHLATNQAGVTDSKVLGQTETGHNIAERAQHAKAEFDTANASLVSEKSGPSTIGQSGEHPGPETHQAPHFKLEGTEHAGFGFTSESKVPSALVDHLTTHGVPLGEAQNTVTAISSGLHHAIDNKTQGEGAQLTFHPQGPVAVSIDAASSQHGTATPALAIDMDVLGDVHRDGLPEKGIEVLRSKLGAEIAEMSKLEVLQTFGHDVVSAVAQEGYPQEPLKQVKSILEAQAQKAGMPPATVTNAKALQALGAAARTNNGTVVITDKHNPSRTTKISANEIRTKMGWSNETQATKSSSPRTSQPRQNQKENTR